MREQVFIASLAYHGFRVTRRRTRLKKRYGYIIPSTKQEDAGLIDFWVKLPGSDQLIPLQVTQRGTAILARRQRVTPERLRELACASEMRLRLKRRACARCGIAFAVIRDYTGARPSKSIAWGDRKALRHAIAARAAPLTRVSLR